MSIVDSDDIREMGRVLDFARDERRWKTERLIGDPGASHLTDLGNAERLIKLHGNDLRYCHPWGKWLVWDGHRWAIDDTAEVERRAAETVRSYYRTAAETEDRGLRETLAEWAHRCESRSKRVAMITSARALSGVPVLPRDLDAKPWLLNCANGTLDLKTGELCEHRREDMMTRCTWIRYEKTANCPLWSCFLNRVFGGDQALIRFVKKAVGYSLTGSTQEQVLFILHGDGANGKSVFIGVLLALLGEYGRQSAPDLLLQKHHDRHPTEIADLAGARMVASVESGEDRRLSENFVKQATGGDRMKARRMREDFWEFYPEFKLWLATNHKPKIQGTEDAIWRRQRLIPFNVKIPESERDPRMLEKLSAELPEILAWAVSGCLEWQREGLAPARAVADATRAYRAEQDVLAAFLEECCVLAQNSTAKASELYQSYVKWCENTGERAESQRGFGTRLAKRGLDRHRSTGGLFHWRGIGLLADDPEPDQRPARMCGGGYRRQ